MHYNIHESSASRIVKKAEDILVNSGNFDLPRKLIHGKTENINELVVIINVINTLIGRPKKTKNSTIVEK